MTCSNCERPERVIWPPGNAPKFEIAEAGNWVSLVKCNACNAHWVSVPYEPHASFPYFVFWAESSADWKKKHDGDEGTALHEWHKGQLMAHKETLTPNDLANIEAHRRRSYGRDPYS